MLTINENKQDKVVVLEIQGRLDAGSSPSLESKIVSLIDGGGKNFILDFSGLEYISSAGLRVLLVAAKKTKSVEGKLALAVLTEPVKEVFDIAGFTGIFAIYPSVDEAAKGMV